MTGEVAPTPPSVILVRLASSYWTLFETPEERLLTLLAVELKPVDRLLT
ncbi:hypothetical protein [Variovorax sp. W2I14]